MMSFKCIVASISLLIIIVSAKSRIKITNNGYTDVVVAIHPDIKHAEGEPLIDKIKELFTSGSAALFKATRKRSYFKEISILVPKSWPKRPNYKIASYEVLTQADVKIEKPNPLHGDGPYTLQPLPCENPGLYIHLTPNYLRQLTADSTEEFGDPGRTLVHEWAHLRYGIFDEYAEQGRAEFPAFYRDSKNGEYLPNACVNEKLVGRRWDSVEKKDCAVDARSQPDKNCIFLADRIQNDHVTSSIASYHYLPNAYTFCDETEEFRHNKYAPNRHNRMCNTRSTWSVITSHEDFKNGNLPNEGIVNTVPTFKVVQEEEATISLVLDISGSMNEPRHHTKIKMLHEAGTRFIKDEVKIGTAVAVVPFSSSAHVKLPMTRIVDEQTRQIVINNIPQSANGGTCIGCGLRLAAQDLRRFRGGNGGTIVLLSDGEENGSPYIRDVTQELVNADIRVITIAFTAAASQNMEALALATGGKSFFVPMNAGVPRLDEAFHDVSSVQTTEEDLTAKLDGKTFISSIGSFENNFYIDSTVGRDTAINFLYTDRNDINDITVSGQGISVSLGTPSTPEVTVEQNNRQIKFIFASMPSGTYTYKVNRIGSTSQDITVTILSKSRKIGEDPIRVECKVDEEKNSNPPKFIITAYVTKGTNPVVKAEVITRIDRPNNYPSVVMQLHDSGKKGDAVRDDGIYSAYFTNITGAGRYNVQATVVANAKTAILETGFTTSSALEILTTRSNPPNVTEVPTGDFQRVAEAGSIQVTQNLNAETTDLFPPSRIDDLQLVNITGQNVVLQWSAPGDDLSNGQAAEYDLRYTMDFELLSSQFFGRQYNDTVLVPKQSGETETLDAQLIGLGPGITYYVAIRTRDKSGKWSEVSNLVEVKGK